jgi:FkbM family methyltransferase
LREYGYRGRIVSFEPLSAAREILLKASSGDPLWEVAPRAAIGSEDGEIEIHVAGNLASSSVLDMMEVHLKNAPRTKYVGVEKVPLRRLDAVGLEYIRSDSVLLIKIDTQGYEDKVLKGATELLKVAVGVHLEMSMVQLYQGQPLFDSLIPDLKERGFEMWDWNPQFFDHQSGRLLQGDGTFYRPAQVTAK